MVIQLQAVLTATCLSYESLCNFLTFFWNMARDQTAWPIWTQNGLIVVNSRTDVYFGVQIETFLKPPTKVLETAKICSILIGTENFRPISHLILGVSRVKTLYSSSEPNKSIIVNRQCRGKKFKYVPKFWIGARGGLQGASKTHDSWSKLLRRWLWGNMTSSRLRKLYPAKNADVIILRLKARSKVRG